MNAEDTAGAHLLAAGLAHLALRSAAVPKLTGADFVKIPPFRFEKGPLSVYPPVTDLAQALAGVRLAIRYILFDVSQLDRDIQEEILAELQRIYECVRELRDRGVAPLEVVDVEWERAAELVL